MDKLLTPNQAAKLLGVSPITIRNWANKKLLSASLTAGGHRRFALSALTAFARERGIAIATLEQKVYVQRILIIDDDESFAGMLVHYLNLRLPGTEVQLAHSGFEAGQMLSSFQPEVILLDLFMPGMSGVETCKMIKDSELDTSPRIVAMTGKYSPEVEQEVIASGADACIGKPIDINRLIAFIED